MASTVVPGAPRNRSFLGSMAGTRGAYVQENPYGARPIRIAGVVTGATTNAVKDAVEADQAAIIGTVGTLTGTDNTYTNCLCVAFALAGPVQKGVTQAIGRVVGVFEEVA